MIRESSLLAAWLVLTAPALAADGAVVLAHKPGAVEVWVRTTRTTIDKKADGTDVTQVIDALSLFTQQSTATTTGGLAFTVTRTQEQAWVNGQELQNDEPEPAESKFSMLPTGRRPDEAAPTPESALTPELPGEAVKPGHSWSVEVPPSKGLPAALKVTHTFEKLENQTATIVTKGAVQGKAEPGPFGVKVEGTTVLDLATGQVVRARGEVRILVKRVTPSVPSGFVQHTRKIIRVTQQKTAAQPAPPDAPAN